MKISTKGRYALRFMLDLAEHDNGEYVRLKDAAAREEISEKYLEQISSALTKGGLIRGVRGSQGGYRLVKEPSKYTVGAILRVTEGSLAPVACLDDEVNACTRSSICRTLPFWQDFYKLINDYLESVTLQDLLDKGGCEIEYNI
jgi:Rrf2 family protein